MWSGLRGGRGGLGGKLPEVCWVWDGVLEVGGKGR